MNGITVYLRGIAKFNGGLGPLLTDVLRESEQIETLVQKVIEFGPLLPHDTAPEQPLSDAEDN